jgi:hypothetical protein
MGGSTVQIKESGEEVGGARTEMEGERSGERRWRKWDKSLNHS